MRRIGRFALLVLAALALVVVVLNWTYGRLPSEQGLDLFFDMGIKAGRFTSRLPREQYWTPAFADTFAQWKPPE